MICAILKKSKILLVLSSMDLSLQKVNLIEIINLLIWNNND